MSSPATALLTLLIFVVSALYAAVGHAGASGDIAAMGLVGVPAPLMKPIALILNLFVASIGTYKFHRAGFFRWPLFWPFTLASVPFAFLGGHITLPSHLYRPLVGAVLLFAAARLLFLTFRAAKDQQEAPPTPIPLLAALAAGALIGLLSGLTGVGGGIFLSPLLLLMGWASTREAAAVSVAFILANSIAGLAGNLTVLHALPTRLILLLIPAAALGGFLGAEFGSRRLRPLLIRRLLALALTIAGAKMLWPT